MKENEKKKIKKDRSSEFYLNSLFASSEEKTNLEKAKKTIVSNLLIVQEDETSSFNSKKNNILEIGKHVGEILNFIKKYNKNESETDNFKKISSSRYLELHFNKDVRRLMEYLAIYKAHEITKEELPLTTLTVLGQAMNSKNNKRSALVNKIIEDGKLPNNRKLGDVSASEFAATLRDFTKVPLTLEEILLNTLKHLGSTEASMKKLCEFEISKEISKEEQSKIRKNIVKATEKIANISSLFNKQADFFSRIKI